MSNVRPTGPRDEAWRRFRSLAKEEREWMLEQIMRTYCLCGSVLDKDGECPSADCDWGDDEDDEEDEEDEADDGDPEEDEEDEADDGDPEDDVDEDDVDDEEGEAS